MPSVVRPPVLLGQGDLVEVELPLERGGGRPGFPPGPVGVVALRLRQPGILASDGRLRPRLSPGLVRLLLAGERVERVLVCSRRLPVSADREHGRDYRPGERHPQHQDDQPGDHRVPPAPPPRLLGRCSPGGPGSAGPPGTAAGRRPAPRPSGSAWPGRGRSPSGRSSPGRAGSPG